MPTPWQNVLRVDWGVLILRVVGLLPLAHENPFSNTPGIASVGAKKEKRAASQEWSKLTLHVSVEGLRTPFSRCSRVHTMARMNTVMRMLELSVNRMACEDGSDMKIATFVIRRLL